MRTRLHITILPLFATAVLAACGGGEGDDAAREVASLGTVAGTGEATSAGTGGDGNGGEEPDQAAIEDAAVRFTRCMREHGVEMPDPQGDGGTIMLQVDGDNADEMQAAQEACQPIMDGMAASFEPPSPEEQARMREQMLEFTRCMREHGVDMPDPQFGEDGSIAMTVGGPGEGGAMTGDPDDFAEASEACGTETGGGFVMSAPVAAGED